MLVSVVAGLGISPPAGNELAGWMHSVQTWVDGQLTWWDARETPGRAAVASEVEEPAEDLSPEAVIEEVLADRAAAVEPARTESEVAATTTATTDREFEKVVDEMAADFSGDVEEGRALAVAPAQQEAVSEEATVADRAGPKGPETDAAMPESEETEVAATSEPEDDLCPGLAYDEPEDDLCPGLAHALNRQNDGLDEPADVPDAQATGRGQIGDAVRLTRDALLAWINLLQSPALVTIPR